MLQLDDFEAWKILFQAQQVFRIGATPRIDALIVIAHSGKRRGFTNQQSYQFILRKIGVLVFIQQHMPNAVLPAFAYRLIIR